VADELAHIALPRAITDRAGHALAREGAPRTRVLTARGTHIATGYQRVVIGGRGAYIEFAREHLHLDQFEIPANAQWRLDSPNAFYLEYRSRDDAFVKLYHQRRVVDYADYVIGMFYIAPADVIGEII